MEIVGEKVSQKQQALEYFKNNGGIYFDVVNLGILEKDGWRVIVDFKIFHFTSTYFSEDTQSVSQIYSLRSKESEIANDLIYYIDSIIKTK